MKQIYLYRHLFYVGFLLLQIHLHNNTRVIVYQASRGILNPQAIGELQANI